MQLPATSSNHVQRYQGIPLFPEVARWLLTGLQAFVSEAYTTFLTTLLRSPDLSSSSVHLQFHYGQKLTSFYVGGQMRSSSLAMSQKPLRPDSSSFFPFKYHSWCCIFFLLCDCVGMDFYCNILRPSQLCCAVTKAQNKTSKNSSRAGSGASLHSNTTLEGTTASVKLSMAFNFCCITL